MALMTLDAALDRLASIISATLVVPSRKAVAEWNELEVSTPSLAATVDATTRAGIIHGLTVSKVREALVELDTPTVRELNCLGFFAVGIGGDLVLRYKFVGGGRPQNVSTKRQRELARHQFDDNLIDRLSFEGVPMPPTLVTCGYTLGFDGKIASVSMQCDNYGHTVWRYVVWGDDQEGFGDFAMLPISPDLAPEATIVRSTRKAREEETGREAQ